MVWYTVKNMSDCVRYGLHNTSEWQNQCHPDFDVVRRWSWELREQTGRGWVVVVSEYTYHFDD